MFAFFSLLLSNPAQADELRSRAKKELGYDFDWEEVQRQAEAPPVQSHDGVSYPISPAMLPQAAEVDLEPNSALAGVIVYTNHTAMVTRHRELELRKGIHSVRFEGLPHAMENHGLGANVSRGNARIVGVELVSHQRKEDSERKDQLRVEVEELTDKIGSLQDEIEGVLARRDYLRAMLLNPPVDHRPTLAELRQTHEYLGQQEQALAAKLRTLKQQAKELGEELTPVWAKFTNPHATGRVVQVDVEVLKPGKIGFELDYRVNGASWSPSYNLRYLPDNDQVRLEAFANVVQSTREEWEGAELRLSTALARQAGRLPVPRIWVLEPGAGFATQDQITGNMAPTVNAPVSSAAQSTGPRAYTIAQASISGDGSPQRVPLFDETMAVDLASLALPGQVEQAFRKGTFVYAGDAPLLAGPLSTFVEADFIGAGHLGKVIPGAEVEVSLGVHERIEVERKLLDRNTKKMGRKQREHFSYRIRVTNYDAKPLTLDLFEQVPVSTHAQIQVDVLDDSEGVQPEGLPPGTLHWEMVLKPGQSRTVDVVFQVTAPTDVIHGVMNQLM